VQGRYTAFRNIKLLQTDRQTDRLLCLWQHPLGSMELINTWTTEVPRPGSGPTACKTISWQRVRFSWNI